MNEGSAMMESAASYGTDGSSANAASASADAAKWEQAYDEAGNLYYYHSVTGETSWERPQEDGLGGLDTGVSDESATIDPAYTDQNWSEPGENSHYGSQEGYYNDSSAYSSETGVWGAEEYPLAEDGWQAIDDGYGNVYYYNHYTNTAVEYVCSLAHGLKPLSGMYQPAVHACKLSCELRLKVA